MSGLVTGTSGSHQRIRSMDLKNLPLILPNFEVIKEYERVVTTIFERNTETITENKALSQLRDTLLPKLMTGKIRVA